METWKARLLVEDELGTREEVLGIEERRVGTKASQGHSSEPETVIRAQSAEETHKAEGQGGVCPEHGPLGAQAGGELSGSAVGKGAIGVSTGLTLGPLQPLIKPTPPGPVASGLGRWRVDHRAALPEARSTRTPTAGSQAPVPGPGLRSGISLRIFQPGSTRGSGIVSWVCGEMPFSNVCVCVAGVGVGVELSSPRNPPHPPAA